MACATTLTLGVIACSNEVDDDLDAHTEPVVWMQAHTQDYLGEDSTAWRRERLEETLWRPDLGYSSKLLSHYGFEREGWDLLPEYDILVESVQASTAADISGLPFKGEGLLAQAMRDAGVEDAAQLSEAQWKALGREVFWKLPMRRDNYVEWLVRKPELWSTYGLSVDERGELRGIVRYQDARGRLKVGMTCALCHAADGMEGRAHEALELGPARAAFRRSQGWDEGVFAGWGAGQVDVTDDDVLDPMSIPNLWGMKHQRYFNGSAVVKIVTPASAAIRFETQYIMNHGYEVRPPRALTWGLAMWLYDMEEPAPAHSPDPTSVTRGAQIFTQRCASCHVPSQGYAGDLIPAETLQGLDDLASRSIDRGTGFYKVPSLVGVGYGGPYLHDSSALTLDALLESGHPFGDEIAGDDRADLIHYVNTL